MTLIHKQRIYLSLSKDLTRFVQEQADTLNITKSKYITAIISKEYESYQRKKIDRIIEGIKD